MAKHLVEEDQGVEVKDSPEAAAAKGAEVKEKVKGRLAAWRDKMLEKNAVAKEYMNAWEKIKTSALEDTWRRHIFDKITPVIEAAAAGRGALTQADKWTLRSIGVVCNVVGLVGMLGGAGAGLPIEAIGVAVDLLSTTPGMVDKAVAKGVGAVVETADHTGFYRKVDPIIDKIFGWKGPDKPSQPVLVAEAKSST